MEQETLNHTTGSLLATTKNTNRRRPLHTCGVTVLTITQKAYSKASSLDGPLGTLLEKLAKFLGPILYIIQYQWLATLSFTDDRILDVESLIESMLPPASYVFDRIDDLVCTSETLPKKLSKILTVMYQIPFLNWTLAHLVITLNFLITTLTDWQVHNAREKDIMIDTNSHHHVNQRLPPNTAPMVEKHSIGSETISPSTDEKRVASVGQYKISYKEVLLMDEKKEEKICEEVKEVEKKKEHLSYKEVLEMGTKRENTEIDKQKEDDDKSNKCVSFVGDEGDDTKEESILELFSSGWHIN